MKWATKNQNQMKKKMVIEKNQKKKLTQFRHHWSIDCILFKLNFIFL